LTADSWDFIPSKTGSWLVPGWLRMGFLVGSTSEPPLKPGFLKKSRVAGWEIPSEWRLYIMAYEGESHAINGTIISK